MMKRILKALKEYCILNSLVVNIKKTNIIIFSKGGKQKQETFYFGNEKVDIVNKCTYLGITFVRFALFETATQELVNNAKLALVTTIKLIKNTYLTSWEKINTLFDSLVKSIILCSSLIWSVRHLDKLEILQCRFFKKLMNLSSCTPNYAVSIECSRQNISAKVFKLILNWKINILRMDNSRLPKLCLEKLIEISINENCIAKYSWISLINKIFLEPINAVNI